MARTWATLDMEQAARREGFVHVAGVDEVGRGPLAGPLTLGLVILPDDFVEPVVDSKLLTSRQRARKAGIIHRVAKVAVVAHVEADYIDTHGLTASLREAGRRLWQQLDDVLQPDIIFLDGKHDYLAAVPVVRTVVRGDQECASIAAASIIAKEARDELMRAAAETYPEYGFESHVGYGTPKHLAALRQYGLTPLHRRSFIKGRYEHDSGRTYC